MQTTSDVHYPSDVKPAITPIQDLKLIAFGAILLLLLTYFDSRFPLLSLLRIVLAPVYILYVPGYCVTSALFPRKDDIDPAARYSLNIGVSIAAASLIALLLDRLTLGIRSLSILLGEFTIIFIFGIAILWRRQHIHPDAVHIPAQIGGAYQQKRSLSRPERVVYSALAITLVVAAASIILIFMTPARTERTTEFYVLGDQGKAEGYPHEVATGENIRVVLGITNREQADQQYYVEVRTTDKGQDGTAVVAKTDSIVVGAGEQVELPVTWQMPVSGEDQQVQFMLFANDSSQIYRQLRLWFAVTDK